MNAYTAPLQPYFMVLLLAFTLSACQRSTGTSATGAPCPVNKDPVRDFGCSPPNTADIPASTGPVAASEQTTISTTSAQTTVKDCQLSRIELNAPILARVQILYGLMQQFRLETNASGVVTETNVFKAVQRCNTAVQKIDVCTLFEKHIVNIYQDSPLLGCTTSQLAKIASLADEYRITDRILTPTTQNGLLRSLVFLKEPLYVSASLSAFFLERDSKSGEAITWYDYIRQQVKIFSEQATYNNYCTANVRAYVNASTVDDLDKKTVVVCPDFAAQNNILDMAATLVHESTHTDSTNTVGWKIGLFVDTNLGRWATNFAASFDLIFKSKGSIVGNAYSNGVGSLPGFVHSTCNDDLYGTGLACDPYFADYYVKDQTRTLITPGAYSYDLFFYERIARDTGIQQYEVILGNNSSTASLSNSSPVRYYDPGLLKMPLAAIKWGCDEGYVEHLTRFQKWYNSNNSGLNRSTNGASTTAYAQDLLDKWQTCLLAEREQAIR